MNCPHSESPSTPGVICAAPNGNPFECECDTAVEFTDAAIDALAELLLSLEESQIADPRPNTG
jgi:hypothetical protein